MGELIVNMVMSLDGVLRVLNRTPNADVVVTPDADLVGHPVPSGS